MGRLIDIAWPGLGISVVAELADELNPELCEDFWRCLPFTVLQDHPIVSGETVFAWAPLVSTAPIRHRERIDEAPAGRIRFSQATGNKFSIQYGKGLETLAQPVLGRVLPDYLRVLPRVGKVVWESTFWNKELIWVQVNAHDTPGGPLGIPTATHPVAKKFIDELVRITTVEPDDLRKIRLGLIPSAGSYGQYFGPWNIADGMLRDYVMYTIYPLLQLLDKLGPEHLTDVLDALGPTYSNFLGYCGFKTLSRFSDDLREAVHQSKSADDIKSVLMAFLLYANKLCAWAYHYFPWHLGIFFGREGYSGGLPGRFAFINATEVGRTIETRPR